MTRKTVLHLSTISLVFVFILVLPYASADNYKVNIPKGTSVPGCEETNVCWDPHTVTINVGDEVTWDNDDDAVHTVTSGSGVGEPDGNFDSSLFMSGNSFSVKFDGSDGPGVPGVYPYFCFLHPWMEGAVVLQSSGENEEDFSQGVVVWERDSYNKGGVGIITLDDPDLNIQRNLLEIIFVTVTSIANPYGTEFTVIETDRDTGIFVGKVRFGDITNQTHIQVNEEDQVFVKYVKILPSDDELIFVDSASIKIQEISPPPSDSNDDVIPPEIMPAPLIPEWVKDQSKWWVTGAISDDEFVQSIQYLMEKEIIVIPNLPESGQQTPGPIPQWIWQMTKWWTNGQTTDLEFANALEFLVEKGIIQIHND